LRPPALVDGQRRQVRYLRVSITDRCNFRCRYCMPEEGVSFVPRAELLSFEEIERLVRVFVSLGVRKVRLTGGEPTLRRGLVDLTRRIAAIPGVEDLAMTTNGAVLDRLAAPLKAAGLRRVNVSLDSLRRDRFAELARFDALDAVLRGIAAAEEAGLRPLKLNTVVVRGINDDELPELVRFAAARGAVLRLIEYMPIGIDGFWSDQTFVSGEEMLDRLSDAFEVAETLGYAAEANLPGGGPARYADLLPRDGGPAVRVGFIRALSHNFCAACNRVRMTATGELQECLAYAGRLSLRDALRAGASDGELGGLIEGALFGKGPGHRFDLGEPHRKAMSAIGG
jgi:cyclic pyranopterin phosphate synthase